MATSGMHRSRRKTRLRRTALLVTGLLLAVAWPAGVPSASADGPTTFSQTTALAIPATGSPNQVGPANPYPSNLTVSGMSGAVTALTVTMSGLTHSAVNDIDALLVAPTGENLVVLSDIGDPTSTLAFASDASLTLADTAATAVPTGRIPTGTYKPTDNPGGDTFPSPAPAPSSETTLAGAFTGINPNGTWRLFVVDDTSGDIGTMAGGWSLAITTTSAAATNTTVASSQSPSTTGSLVTFTATVTSGASPVTTGTVQFSDGATPLGSPVPVSGGGTATYSTSTLPEGAHAIRGTYSGSIGFLTSNGSLNQEVDNVTVVDGHTFCNEGPVTIPAQGSATPYPSHVTVSGLDGSVTGVTATLKGLAHQVPVDLDVMLSAPQQTPNVVLMSDTGGLSAVSGLDVTFDDAAATGILDPVVSGSFRPTDDDTDGSSDAFPAPAPTPSSATSLSTFDGTNPNGTWSLWALDDATGDAGSIGSGWCLTVATGSPTSTTLVSSSNPSTVGEPVTFTATVTSGGSAVASGSVQFSDGGTQLGLAVPVAADGTASFTTSSLVLGTHPVRAEHAGDGYLSSSGSLTQVVEAVTEAPPHLTLVKKVVNDSGGGARRTDWTLSARGPTHVSGVTGSVAVTEAVVAPGWYALAEYGGPDGYAASGWRCTGARLYYGLLKVTPGAEVECVITNNDKPRGHLTLVKKVVNDDRGHARATDWTLSARGQSRIAGATGSPSVTKALVISGWYALAESGGPSGYVASTWRCPGATVSSGKVLVGPGAWVVCTIVNNDWRR